MHIPLSFKFVSLQSRRVIPGSNTNLHPHKTAPDQRHFVNPLRNQGGKLLQNRVPLSDIP